MKSSNLYPLKVRAEAMEKLLSGVTVKDVARFVGCMPNTISRWYLDYRGYQGCEGITEVRQSIINDENQ